MKPINLTNFTERFPTLVSGLKPDEQEALFEAMVIQEMEAGQTLIAESTQTDALYLVWDGVLDVYMNTPYGERPVAQVGPGALLGEVSLMDPGLATATVRTEQGCTALYLCRACLEALWQTYPQLASLFLQELSRTIAARIRVANTYLENLLTGQAAPPAYPLPKAIINAHTQLFEVEVN